MTQLADDKFRGRVAIVEDEEPVANQLRDRLSKAGFNVVDVFLDYNTFEDRFKQCPVDAVSLDWQMGQHGLGPQAIEYSKRVQPAATRIMCSHLPEQREAATKLGADWFVDKNREKNGEYENAMQQGVRLGLCRQLAAEIKSLKGESNTLSLDWLTFSNDTEVRMRDQAHKVATNRAVPYPDRLRLMQKLVRRGWWKVFDAERYVGLPQIFKLRELIRYADIDGRGLKSMVPDGAGLQFLSEAEACDTGGDYELTDVEDGLLSIFFYFLHLSDYHPDWMRVMVNENIEYQGREDPPPWQKTSLLRYLEKHGSSGVKDCTIWVRKL